MERATVSYLPHYENSERRLQAEIGVDLIARVDKIRRKKKLTWKELLTGMLQKFADDVGPLMEKKPVMTHDDERDQINMFYDERMVK